MFPHLTALLMPHQIEEWGAVTCMLCASGHPLRITINSMIIN